MAKGIVHSNPDLFDVRIVIRGEDAVLINAAIEEKMRKEKRKKKNETAGIVLAQWALKKVK